MLLSSEHKPCPFDLSDFLIVFNSLGLVIDKPNVGWQLTYQ